MLLFLMFLSQGFADIHAHKRTIGIYSIVGHHASIKDYPSLVGLRGNKKRCTGTLVTQHFIVTAAHCLKTPPTGAYFGNTVITDGERYDLTNGDFFPHLGFKGNITERTDDIAMIRVSLPIKLSESVTIAKMAEKYDVFKIGTVCKMAGWGSLDQYHHVATNLLHEAEMKLIDPKECAKEGRINSETELCLTVVPGLNETTAKGDSGTSLWCKKEGDNQYLLTGVDSRGKDQHSIFTKISQYRDWIDMILASYQ